MKPQNPSVAVAAAPQHHQPERTIDRLFVECVMLFLAWIYSFDLDLE
jgi:hypothetical protein